jgi:hypothetical protein
VRKNSEKLHIALALASIDTNLTFPHDNLGMEGTCLTRLYLESLSNSELLLMADRFGLDIPPGLKRIFVIEELLEVAFGNEEESADDDVQSDFLEAAALPGQYNITFINILIRDPLWAFVFWEIKNHDRDLYENLPDFTGYCLRVIPIGEKKVLPVTKGAETGNKAGGENAFTVSVGPDDNSWYLGFPPEEGCYQVELCALRALHFVPLAVSKPFRMPLLIEPVGKNNSGNFKELADAPLVRLSGLNEFPVMRNAERQLHGREDSPFSLD